MIIYINISEKTNNGISDSVIKYIKNNDIFNECVEIICFTDYTHQNIINKLNLIGNISKNELIDCKFENDNIRFFIIESLIGDKTFIIPNQYLEKPTYFTGIGDGGCTVLTGMNIKKNESIIIALGALDELQASLMYLKVNLSNNPMFIGNVCIDNTVLIDSILKSVKNMLDYLFSVYNNAKNWNDSNIDENCSYAENKYNLQHHIDCIQSIMLIAYENKYQQLNISEFVFFTKYESSLVNLTRTIARRTESNIIAAYHTDLYNVFMNRKSDLIFKLANRISSCLFVLACVIEYNSID